MKRLLFLLLGLGGATAQGAQFSVSDGAANFIEGSSTRNMAFTVRLSERASSEVSVRYATTDLTATAGRDYTAAAAQISFKPGQTSAVVNIPVRGDKTEEADERFRVLLSDPKGATLGDREGIGAVLDDDFAGKIGVSDASLLEGNSGTRSAKMTVSLSQKCLHPLSVSFLTRDGSALAGQDYAAQSGTLLFGTGNLSKGVNVPVAGDTLVERDETFTFRLSAAGYSFSKSAATVVIRNEDKGPMPTPVPTAVPTATPLPTPTTAPTPVPTAVPTPVPTAVPTPVPTAVPTPVPAPGVLPGVSTGSGKIVFASILRTGSRISVINADGSGETQLTPDSLPGVTSDYGDTSPSFSRDGTKITFISTRDGKTNVYVMNSDGTNPQRLTTNFFDESPSFSPDGSKIVWASLSGSGRRIFVMNADGTQQTRVDTRGYSDTAPQFSPDGRRIIFTSERTPTQGASFSYDIFAVNLDGSGETRLTTTDFAAEIAPAVSPNGAKIAFVTTGSGDGRTPGIYTANSDGSGVSQISQNLYQDAAPSFAPDNRKIAFGAKYRGKAQILVMNTDGSGLAHLVTQAAAAEPSWAPGSVPVTQPAPTPIPTPTPTTTPVPPEAGGGKIAFSSRRHNFMPNFLNDEIYIMNADGTNPTRLTFTSCDFQPNLSRDGSKIVWMSHRNTEQIYIMNADGTNPTRIGDASVSNSQPCFSPDASKIVFTSRVNGVSGIYLMNADGTGRIRLSDGSANDSSARFSPDGTKIVFTSTPFISNRYPRVWLMNADGTGRTPLTSTILDYSPTFSPDGKTVAFYSSRYGAAGIYSIGVDGYDLKLLSSSISGADSSPCFSPDGKKIAFIRASGNYGIHTMNPDGTGKTHIPGTGTMDSAPSWSVGSVPAPTKAKTAASKAASKPSAPSS